MKGPIPREFGRLKKLFRLMIDCCDLTGMFCDRQYFCSHVKANHDAICYYFHTAQGTIPSELGQLILLERLHLKANQLTGTNNWVASPETMVYVISAGATHATFVTEGIIPTQLSRLTNLEALDLEKNRLSGMPALQRQERRVHIAIDV